MKALFVRIAIIGLVAIFSNEASAHCLERAKDCDPHVHIDPPPRLPTASQAGDSASHAVQGATNTLTKTNREVTNGLVTANKKTTDALARTNSGATNALAKGNREGAHVGAKTGDELANAGRRFMQVGNEWGKAFNDAVCDIAQGPQKDKKKPRTDCSTSAGVGYDSGGGSHGGGGVYTYDPSNPSVHYPIGPDDFSAPTDADIRAMVRDPNFKSKEIEDWERIDNDRFIAPGSKLGLPWTAIVGLPTKEGLIRRPGGDFLDIRQDDRYLGGYRIHAGVDYLNKIGDEVFAIVSGTARLFCPHFPGHWALEITTKNGYVIQQLYLLPPADVMGKLKNGGTVQVERGQVIGYAQDVSVANGKPAYRNTPQHTHVTMKDPQGRYVSPNGSLYVLVKKKGK